LDQLIAQLTARKFILHRHEMLEIGRLSVPAAWVVIAQKSNK